ncbi:hypothetical protein Pst134EA_007214 [Puccinia striiformis f. sp. tritici]|uniref:hypothetical protein n=1 Tax=Puccinia striiformis f. sp. tritici TaxID=168172 RepID=UPI0020089BB6|nr:hypothetical protein Pst134EA_007214 [Puccinia striiformis f. sp. tritici]KAH9469941.1 hypothetical protein Pst134EA_007214 [Puccinia striiformis f. sp. tritici]
MGYDPTISETIPHYPFMKKIKLTKEEKVQCPQALASDYPDHEFQQIASLELNKHESIKKAHFVLVNTARSGKYVAQGIHKDKHYLLDQGERHCCNFKPPAQLPRREVHN